MKQSLHPCQNPFEIAGCDVFVCTWLVLHVKAIKVYLDASDDIDSCIRIRSSYQPQFTKLQTRLP